MASFVSMVNGFYSLGMLEQAGHADRSRDTLQQHDVTREPVNALQELLLVFRFPTSPLGESFSGSLSSELQPQIQRPRYAYGKRRPLPPLMEVEQGSESNVKMTRLQYEMKLEELVKVKGLSYPEAVASFPPPPEVLAEIHKQATPEELAQAAELNNAKFQDQLSDDYNKRIMEAYPQSSEVLQDISDDRFESDPSVSLGNQSWWEDTDQDPTTIPTEDASELPSTRPTEDEVYEARIREAENRVKVLMAEKKVLRLRKSMLDLREGRPANPQSRNAQMSELLGAMVKNPARAPALLEESEQMLLQPFRGVPDENSIYGDATNTLDEKVEKYANGMAERIARARESGKEAPAAALELMMGFVLDKLGFEKIG